MTSDYLDPQIIGEHNHEPSDTRINVSKACVDMKTNARNNDEKPGNIFANTLEQLDDLTRAHIPSVAVCKRTIRNHKAMEFPNVPNSLHDLVIDENGQCGMTREVEPRPFLFYNNGVESDSRIIAFGKDT